MSDRWEKRKNEAEIKSIVKKAKQDMADWVDKLEKLPSSEELLAWQAGYLSGINRATGQANK